MMKPMARPSTGTATATSQESPTSWRIAMMTPPTIMIGADTIMVNSISTSIWICWTSLVVRVISDGAPKPLTSRLENPRTRPNTDERRSRPKAMAVRAPKYTAVTEPATWSSETPSITAPRRRMYPVSPWTTPLSMMSALSIGRYSEAMVAASCNPTIRAIQPL